MIRCITAIWPAGPPKLSSATRVHTRSASRRLTPCARAAPDLLASASPDIAVPRFAYWLVGAVRLTCRPAAGRPLQKRCDDDRVYSNDFVRPRAIPRNASLRRLWTGASDGESAFPHRRI